VSAATTPSETSPPSPPSRTSSPRSPSRAPSTSATRARQPIARLLSGSPSSPPHSCLRGGRGFLGDFDRNSRRTNVGGHHVRSCRLRRRPLRPSRRGDRWRTVDFHPLHSSRCSDWLEQRTSYVQETDGLIQLVDLMHMGDSTLVNLGLPARPRLRYYHAEEVFWRVPQTHERIERMILRRVH
jgi:hypothetical protein